MKKLKYWIKERRNPRGTYFVACGQLTKEEAKEKETGCLYGSNKMHSFNSEKEYQNKLSELNIKE
jgi:hypothetical protein